MCCRPATRHDCVPHLDTCASCYLSSIRISTLSGRSLNTLKSEVISPIFVRVGTELVGA
jgi:hypothetical protein